jgi:hypothetical protein
MLPAWSGESSSVPGMPVPEMRRHAGAPRSSGLRVIVLGYVVRGPIGGIAAYHLNYLLGLAALGHDVYFVEDSDDYPSCYDPDRQTTDIDPSYGLRFAADVFERAGFGARWAYHDAHRAQWHGPCAGRIAALCQSADLLLDLGGVNPLRPMVLEVPARALVDLDPVFTQIRHMTDAAAHGRAGHYTSFFSVAHNIGAEGCTIPDDGCPWQPTRQPLVADLWPVIPAPANGRFTTVMQWESYPAVEHEGMRYGLKSDSFAPLLDLPARAGDVFELAVGARPAALEPLRRHGWRVRDPLEASRDLAAYAAFIRGSAAEFGIAKHAYVASGSGWFSDRTLLYLATGRPALVQETGCSQWLPTGTGLVAFSTADEAAEGIADIRRRYATHCDAAAALAREYFAAEKVLPPLVERAMAGVESRA